MKSLSTFAIGALLLTGLPVQAQLSFGGHPYGVDGRALKDAAAMTPGANVTIEVRDGRRDARIEGESAAPPPAKRTRSAEPPAKPSAAKKQEELF